MSQRKLVSTSTFLKSSLALLITAALLPATAAARKYNPLPVLSYNSPNLEWTATAPRGNYILRVDDPGSKIERLKFHDQLSYTPTADEGDVVTYEVKTYYNAPNEWSNPVTLTFNSIEKEREEQHERELKEQAEREAKEQAEREAKEQAEREAREKAEKEKASSFIVGVDAGGWDWESAVNDFAGAVKYVRSSYTNYNSDSQMALLAKNGVHLMPLFNEWTAGHVLAWFQRYGHGGSFWVGRTDYGATTVEVVNEPGNPFFWGSGAQTDQSKYAATVEEYNRVLSSLGSLKPRLLVSYDGGYEGDNYGRRLVEVDPNLKTLSLGWTVHPYGGHGSNSALGNRPRVTESLRPVYVTEVGWPTCGETGDSLNWSESQQAENITNFAHWSRELGYVSAFINFNYADYSGNCYGIVHAAGSPHKLSYNALKAVAEGR